jgi:Fe-S-cluster containining protein
MAKRSKDGTNVVDLWYKDGLHFKCTGCGKCCTGEPGFVWITEEEIKQMALFLKISIDEFVRRYARKIFGRFSLIENKVNFDCVFLKNKQCQIYEARPQQCRKFPWWKEILQSKECWDETGKRCEGINHPDAPLVSLKEIEQ